jgi:AraC family transcriptional regulator of adaptative response / DNA-3-methyladenine glycosylase II
MVHALLAFLAARAVPGIEESTPAGYRRTLRLPHGPAILRLRAADHDSSPAPHDDAWSAVVVGGHHDSSSATVVVAAHARDREAAAAAGRRLLGPDPAPAAAHLGADPVLGRLVAQRPGLGVPGTVDGGELAIRAVIGQQVSVAAARTLAGRLVAAAGDWLDAPDGALTHLWPRPEAITEAAGSLAMPRARRTAVATLARALAEGDLRLEPGADPAHVRRRLLDLPGIGPWTASYIAMRALGDPDAWLPTDLGVRHALARLGADPSASDAWRPYRAFAVMHLWASLA